ncbi:putative endonuclease [Rhodoblastus acidophilus]|uniref:GIY-YIG nuclease family protein n=1 Tax=Rhodoblastus acidophilus TaxID=1074 RepID=UPI0029CABDC7|nr:GIY-YIG nuclease family protein [Rhodoblastus acidophilus]MCW2285560.1 putative endonuclease [Rhodoblastus acidophilus]MCW2334524.1 putative endonuclease [Rhodoblastus acidophilus]
MGVCQAGGSGFHFLQNGGFGLLAWAHPPSCAGLSRASTPAQHARMKGGWVYIVTNRPNGILYTGVTADLARRIYEHRTGAGAGFTQRYGLHRLVYYERYEDIVTAIQREKNVKHWPRAWKARLIVEFNEDWRDLYDDLA